MSDVSVTWFPSKVDWWLRIALFLPPIGSLAALGSSFANQDRAETVMAAATCVGVGALYALFVVPIRYGIGPEKLIVRFGVFRQRIALDAIEEVSPTHNPLSSPALSIDRLAVRTGSGLLSATMISPTDREAFLTLLAANSGMRRADDRLTRD